MKIALFLILSALFCGQACATPKYTEKDFIGVWYHLNPEGRVDLSDVIEISKVRNGLLTIYRSAGKTFEGVLLFNVDGLSFDGLLKGFGAVSLSKTESLSEFRNGSISMDQINEIENIDLGFFQKKEVLEKLLNKKLP